MISDAGPEHEQGAKSGARPAASPLIPDHYLANLRYARRIALRAASRSGCSNASAN